MDVYNAYFFILENADTPGSFQRVSHTRKADRCSEVPFAAFSFTLFVSILM